MFLMGHRILISNPDNPMITHYPVHMALPCLTIALKVEGLARVSKNAGGRPRLASVAFDGRYMGLAL